MTKKTTGNKINLDMFHLMYAKQLGMEPAAYAAKVNSDQEFRHQVETAFSGYAVAVNALRLQIIGGSKLSIEEIAPGVAKIRLGVGEWELDNTPKNTEVALDDFLISSNFLTTAV